MSSIYKLLIIDYTSNKVIDYIKSPYKTKRDSFDYFRNIIKENPILLNKNIYTFDFVEVIDNVNYSYR